MLESYCVLLMINISNRLTLPGKILKFDRGSHHGRDIPSIVKFDHIIITL